jgi:hypothetical protein
MYYIKKNWLLVVGWFSSASGKYCYYHHRAQVLRAGKEIGGLVVVEPRNGQTVILCDDGVVQRGGVWRPVK